MSARIAVLIVSYFSTNLVAELAQDLARDEASDRLHLSIVDNSTDTREGERLRAALEPLAAQFGSMKLSHAPQNRGYAGGNNLAYSNVAGRDFDVILVMNPDLRIRRGSVSSVAEMARATPRSVVVPRAIDSSKVLDGRGALSRWTGRSRQLVANKPVSHGWLVYPGGHFMAVSRALWERAEGFSEDFFLYAEEADFFLRLGLATSDLVTSSDLVVVHSSGATTHSQHGRKSSTTLFNAARSNIILFRKHARLRPFLPLVVLSRLAFAALTSARRDKGSRVVAGIWAGLTWRGGSAYLVDGQR